MTKKNCLVKVLVLAAMLCIVLGLVSIAHADGSPCEGGVHKGPFTYVTINPASCTEDGSQDKYCSACGEKIGNEPIIHIGHKFETVSTVIRAATCTADGLQQDKSICRVCGYQESVTDVKLPALGHDWGDWMVKKAATCEADGVEARYCKRCGVEETRPITAIGHKWDSGTVTKQPNCTEEGVKTFVCQNDPSHTKTESIAIDPNAHNYDSGKVTKQPTCTEAGEKVYTCSLNSAHTKTETIPVDPNAHDWDAGTVVVPADCETDGTMLYTCKINSAHTKNEKIPATGHKWDAGTVVTPATRETTGLKHYVCENNSAHTKDEVIPKITFGNNTLCAFGPRLRDVDLYPYNTDVWYMFTPFDASRDGRQTYDLIASNMYVVGTVTLTIKDGKVTVDYTLNSSTIDVTLEFFTILPQISAIHTYEPEQLESMKMRVRTPIDLEENFGEDRNLVLYFCSRADYTYSDNFTSLVYNSPANQRLLNEMLLMMDR